MSTTPTPMKKVPIHLQSAQNGQVVNHDDATVKPGGVDPHTQAAGGKTTINNDTEESTIRNNQDEHVHTFGHKEGIGELKTHIPSSEISNDVQSDRGCWDKNPHNMQKSTFSLSENDTKESTIRNNQDEHVHTFGHKEGIGELETHIPSSEISNDVQSDRGCWDKNPHNMQKSTFSLSENDTKESTIRNNQDEHVHTFGHKEGIGELKTHIPSSEISNDVQSDRGCWDKNPHNMQKSTFSLSENDTKESTIRNNQDEHVHTFGHKEGIGELETHIPSSEISSDIQSDRGCWDKNPHNMQRSTFSLTEELDNKVKHTGVRVSNPPAGK